MSALATALLAFAAMLPGLLLSRGERLGPGGLGAAAAASMTVAMMATALLATAVHVLTGNGLPALALLPVSLALAGLAYWRTRGQAWLRPSVEWQGLAVAAFFVALGAVVYALSVSEPADGSLRLHAFYNADWFKHIGHSFAIADYGLPARDIFGNGRPLHYYWLSHVLPGASTAAGGDAWAALYVANAIFGALLALTLYGAVRLSGATPNLAAIVAVLATVICATPAGWLTVLAPGGIDAILVRGETPGEPALMSLAFYIPQHALVLALLLGWAVLTLNDERPAPRMHSLALAALATALTVSILFGATLLAVYGLVELWRRRFGAIPELVIMAIASVLLMAALNVLKLDDLGASPGLDRAVEVGEPGAGPLQRYLNAALNPVAVAGLPALLAIYLALRWQPTEPVQRNARLLAVVLLLVAVGASLLAEIAIGTQVAAEVRLRAINLIAVAAAITGGWALSSAWAAGRKARVLGATVLAGLVLAGAPTAILRVLWHATPISPAVTIIPADDRAVLAALRSQSRPREVVWQYPEQALLTPEGGGDIWSAVLAGRTNVATPRATYLPAAAADMALAHRYFAGEDVPVPLSADWIYLSRELHPASFDDLVGRLRLDPQWRAAACRPNACVFERANRR